MLVSQVYHYCGVPISRILKRIQDERKQHYNHMHGVFPGETTELSVGNEANLRFLHAVTIAENSWASQRAIRECDFERHNVKVYSIRRGKDEMISPSIDTIMLEDDIIVLSGRPRRIERAERKLLDGR